MEDLKTFNIRVPVELWSFLKKRSVDVEMPMNSILCSLLKKYKKSLETPLQLDDAKL